MKYIITGKHTNGESWTETASGKQELEKVLAKIEGNSAVLRGSVNVRKAGYMVEHCSENRETCERYSTKADALKAARSAVKFSKAYGIRSHVEAFEECGAVFFNQRTTGTKYAK